VVRGEKILTALYNFSKYGISSHIMKLFAAPQNESLPLQALPGALRDL
jgi:hypothetical protein